MKELKKNKKITTEDLAIMVAKVFENMATKTDIKELKKDISELKESNKDIRKDILNLGDRFVSYHTFDALANRVKVLEEKKR